MLNKLLSSSLAVALLASTLVGCGSTAPETSGTPDSSTTPSGGESASTESLKIGFTTMDNSNPFFVTIEETVRELVEADGHTLVSVDPANDVSLQITQIEDLIVQGIDAMLLNPAEAEGILPALDMLANAGIPIINFDTEVADLDKVASYVGSDNFNAGVVCGEDLVAKLPDGGSIIVLDSPTMNSINDRTAGFLSAIEGANFEIVAQQDAKGNLEQSMGITEDLLQAHGDVVAIFGGNDPTALGALAAANAAGITGALIYGVDGSPDVKAEIASGTSLLEGSGAQSPVAIATTSVQVMYDVLAGTAVDARYPVETFLITADNVDEFGVDGWQ